MTLTPQKRRLHLIDKHGYPRHYDFRVVETGLGDRLSILRGKPAKPAGRRRRVSDVGEPQWQAGGKGIGTEQSRKGRRGIRDRRQEVGSTTGDDGAEADVEDQNEDSEEESSLETSRTARPSGSSMEIKADVDTLMSGMAALKFVPTPVRLKDKNEVRSQNPPKS